MIRLQLVDEEGRLVLDGEEGILHAVARHAVILAAAEKQHRGMNAGERPGAAKRC